MTEYTEFPEELRKRPQWVCWAAEGRDGETAKVPKRPDGSGRNARPDDMATWGSFAEAIAESEANGWGIGFVFSAADPYVAIDIDACLTDSGELADWLPGLDEITGVTYVERSPSGTGLHVILRDTSVPGWWTNQHDDATGREVGVYEEGRYFTVTGGPLEGAAGIVGPVEDLEGWLVDVWRCFNGEEPPVGEDPSVEGNGPQLSLYDVDCVDRAGYPEGRRRPHPIHGSSTGANFMVDDGARTFRCWRAGHECTGNALHLIGVEQGVIECGEWVPDGLDDATWRAVFEAGRAAGYDIEPPTESERVPADGDSRDPGDLPPAGPPSPDDIRELAGLGGDEPLKRLQNRELAHHAWRWIDEHDHVLAAQPDGHLYAYDDGVWTPTGEQRLRELAEALLDTAYSEGVHREICERVRATNPVDRDELGVDGRFVAVENGLLDLETRVLRELEPADRALVRLPVSYDPDARAERWREFVDRVVPEEWQDALQEFVGYCLLVGELPIHRALMLVGEGANGKSTFLTVVRRLLGEDNVAAHSLYEISGSVFARANLFGKVANIHGDLSPSELGPRSAFKTLVGGDAISARHLYEVHFEFEPTAKLLFSANQVPSVDIEDTAFFRRWLLVEFPEWIPPEERNPALPERLTSEEALSGVLNWALDGLDRLLEQGRFTNEGYAMDTRDRWLAWGDSIRRFIGECVEVDAADDARWSSAEVYRAYVRFCRAELGEQPQSQMALTNGLKAAGADYGHHRIDGAVQRGFKRLAFTDGDYSPPVGPGPEQGRLDDVDGDEG